MRFADVGSREYVLEILLFSDGGEKTNSAEVNRPAGRFYRSASKPSCVAAAGLLM
jgi:hypothetical protein